MSDNLLLCANCGDCYTTGYLCTGCKRQADIDSYVPGEYTEERKITYISLLPSQPLSEKGYLQPCGGHVYCDSDQIWRCDTCTWNDDPRYRNHDSFLDRYECRRDWPQKPRKDVINDGL
jgi:hypothetical protein